MKMEGKLMGSDAVNRCKRMRAVYHNKNYSWHVFCFQSVLAALPVVNSACDGGVTVTPAARGSVTTIAAP